MGKRDGQQEFWEMSEGFDWPDDDGLDIDDDEFARAIAEGRGEVLAA